MLVIEVSDVKEAKKLVLHEYREHALCIGEILTSVEIHGMSVEDVVKLYAELYDDIEGDEICRVDEDGMRYSIGT